MICCRNTYVDAVTTDDINIPDVDSVRINKEDNRLYFEYLYESLVSEISKYKKYRLSVLLAIRQLLEKHGIKLEELN